MQIDRSRAGEQCPPLDPPPRWEPSGADTDLPYCAPAHHPDIMIDEPLTDAELDAIEARVVAASKAPWQSFVEGRDHTSGDTTSGSVGSMTTNRTCTCRATPGPQASPIKTSLLTHGRTCRGC